MRHSQMIHFWTALVVHEQLFQAMCGFFHTSSFFEAEHFNLILAWGTSLRSLV